MKKQKKLIVGNWKMNPPSIEEAKKIAGEVKRGLRQIKKSQVVICPPFVYLGTLSNFPSGSFFLGSQDAFYEPIGHFTGEVSFSQLLDFKINFVILGHSERRAMGESDQVINKKVKAVVGEGMTAILCVGEKERDHHGDYLSFVRKQITEGLKDVSGKILDRVVVAYEPIWAVGAKQAMPPEEIHEMSIFIRKTLRDMYGLASDNVRVLYGGAVNTVDAGRIIKGGFVNGLLIGRESLKPKDFVQIIKLTDSI